MTEYRSLDPLSEFYYQRILSAHVEADTLILELSNGTLFLTDTMQQCCEHRYMQTDDDLSILKGKYLSKIVVKDGTMRDDGRVTCIESQFLELHYHIGFVTIKSYNEHNGYYGGFDIRWKFEPNVDTGDE